eukprot:GEMP01005589.1.p1 GENE.GEMP01005589.1~~GEMP01005589.1.p1  ORF type:complete len:1000 (+),score=209.10 GEMP01005589.1:68-3001(+)
MVEFIAAAAAGAHALFSYNRSNFFFDQEMRIKREYQGQDMRIKQFELYREDVRDLVGLTIGKMDNYLIVNTLQLGFCISLFCEGRLDPKTPDWLLWLYTMCLAGAFMYLILSVWLAMHASIAAHSFGVRLLTQVVRLPVPTSIQLNAARAYATDFEGTNVNQMLRVPVWKQQAEKLKDAMAEETKDDSADEAERQREEAAGRQQALMDAVAIDALPVTVLEHIRLYRQLQANWQSYDAYARVCMSMGTNQLLHALTYYCLGFLLMEDTAPAPAWACAITFTTASWLLVKLDLFLNKRVLWFAGVLLITGFLLGCIGTTLKHHPKSNVSNAHRLFVPWVFALHVAWIVFIVCIAKGDSSLDNVALPTKFRAVLYLDVFGWCDHANDSYYEAEANFIRGHVGHQASPARVRAMLCAKCRDLSARCVVQLQCWQKTKDLNHLEPEDVSLLEDMQKTYDESHTDMRECIGLLPSLQEVQQGGGDVPVEHPALKWVKLEVCNPMTAHPLVYFCNVDTNQIVWPSSDKKETDIGPVAPSLSAVGSHITEFMECVRSLKMYPTELPGTPPLTPAHSITTVGRQASSSRPPPLSSPPQSTSPMVSPRTVVPMGSPLLQRALSQHSTIRRPARQQNSGTMLAVPSQSSPRQERPAIAGDPIASVPGSPAVGSGYRPFEDEDSMNPSQETRFGGREAAACLLREAPHHFSHSASAGATFHPEETVDDGRHKTPPGQIPWRVFYHGSVTLIVIWTMGTIWSIFSLGFDFNIMPREPNLAASPSVELMFNQTINITPPHPFFRVDSLACDGTDLYFGETFKIHHYKGGEMSEICQLQSPLVDFTLHNSTLVLLYEDYVALNCTKPSSPPQHKRAFSAPLAVTASEHAIYVLSDSHLWGLSSTLQPLFVSPSVRSYDKLTTLDNIVLGLRGTVVEHAWDLQHGKALSSTWTHLAAHAQAVCATRVDGVDVVYVVQSPYTVQQYLLPKTLE